MNSIVLFTNLSICAGVVIMAFNIWKYYDFVQIVRKISNTHHKNIKTTLIFHLFLITLFFFGYLIILFAFSTVSLTIGDLIVSIIFLTSAIFVLLSINLKKKLMLSIETAYKDTRAMNRKLSDKQKELTQSNQSLIRLVEKAKLTESTLKRSYDTQTIVNRILKQSLTDASMMDVVNLSLDLILSLPGFSFESRGCIYLVENNSSQLTLKTHKGFSESLKQACATVPFGRCICGKAAASRQIIFSDHMDDEHDVRLPDMLDHGHYCVPIQAKGQLLGLINIYVKPGKKRNEIEEDFLKTVANTLAIILIQHKGEQQKKDMEKQLFRSQKMESIGTLASGIAHDFNNILSGIIGYAQLAEMHLDEPEKATSNIHQINEGAKRASDLIQQILTFSRQTTYKKSPIKPYVIVKEAIKFLRSSIPTTISINEHITSQSYVKADPSQIHQIIMNLCTNASHAMQEKGGRLSISLVDMESKTPNDIPDMEIEPGDYINLTVSDTGHGIAPDTLNKIFEPYFTTKRITEGTGLGLAVVLGIVEEHGGYIKAQSTVGYGSTFEVFFPMLKEDVCLKPTKKKNFPLVGGNEHIMVVDDEDSVLSSTSEMLRDFGYKVSPFSNPESAYETFKKEPDIFRLIITDMTMPKITGDLLAKKLLELRGKIPIILCTGYSNKISKNSSLKIGIRKFLTKPVDSKKLLFIIREILDKEKPDNLPDNKK